MRTTKIITISLPPALAHQFAAMQKIESRTGSELFREALRTYIEARYPLVKPTKAEMVAIRRAQAEIRRGEVMPFRKFLNELESRDNKKRSKGTRKTTSVRTRTH